MLTCKQASQLVSQSLDRPLSLPDRIRLRFHLFICDACTRFNQQLNKLRIAVQALRGNIENDSAIQLPLEAKARIVKHVSDSSESNQH
ncbi:MAG: zf-HC2 domain-containing protein [Methylotenera sp.]|nr:zf-HC2 domain-containing protein [Methylotenera sp.]